MVKVEGIFSLVERKQRINTLNINEGRSVYVPLKFTFKFNFVIFFRMVIFSSFIKKIL